MPLFTRRRALFTIGSVFIADPARTAPIRYELDESASNVGFRFTLNGIEQPGSMPVQTANIVIDPHNLAGARVDVTLDVTRTRTSLIFATQALKGPQVLDAARFPTIRFVSKSVHLASDGRLSGGARIQGLLTIRGVTRPITLNASLYRARGSATDDLGTLTVRLDGSVSRAAHGATGFPELVDDLVVLDITAAIKATR